jgi:hypothetical protein
MLAVFVTGFLEDKKIEVKKCSLPWKHIPVTFQVTII